MVAIIGGFLVSRLVSLAGQRQSLVQRVYELHDETDMVRAEFDEVAAERRAESFDTFRGWVDDRLVEERGVLSADLARELLEQVPRGSSEGELRPYLEHLAARVRLLVGVAEKASSPDNLSVQALQQSGADVDDDDAHLLRLVREAERENRRRSRATIDAVIGRGILLPSGLGREPAYRAVELQRQDALIAREGELRNRLALLSAQATISERELSAIRSPREVWVGLVALIYLAFVGVVFPLYLATRRPVPDSPGMRMTIVVLFCTGLAAPLAYVVWSLMRLQRPMPIAAPSAPSSRTSGDPPAPSAPQPSAHPRSAEATTPPAAQRQPVAPPPAETAADGQAVRPAP